MAKPSLRSFGIAFFTGLVFYLIHSALSHRLQGVLFGIAIVLLSTFVYGFLRMIRKISTPRMWDLIILFLFALLMSGILWAASLYFKLPIISQSVAITTAIVVLVVTFLMELVH